MPRQLVALPLGLSLLIACGCQPGSPPAAAPPPDESNKTKVHVDAPGVNVDVKGRKGEGGDVNVDVKKRQP